jgi:hypothetical protein
MEIRVVQSETERKQEILRVRVRVRVRSLKGVKLRVRV